MLYGSFYEEDYTGKEVEGFLARAKSIVNSLGDDFSFELFAYEVSMFGQEAKPVADHKDKNNVIAALKLKAEQMTG